MSRASRLKRVTLSRKKHKANGGTTNGILKGYGSVGEMILHKGEGDKIGGAFGGKKDARV